MGSRELKVGYETAQLLLRRCLVVFSFGCQLLNLSDYTDNAGAPVVG
jgi:hypothetical protein